ncbi:4a-hydroxytetrahydrobiopterin dehydratase [Rhizobacter sp. AJA081-3]|uniref:4a-hydroxytetrahydrobiopterin dehydratase n=1 Tax=Rhizobacter sp. AJA081-3 TaxID=2753607 RepID=UPI001AE0B2B8|nr:4a-hydroxytetrahydrobiopterin dehydratase [Rhizobacter sp. AJA081-3]QTN25563.1 4a-hydroxytetrahydrobiopterin dehydratase [Rhizobacter sp. AJA081-3]
MSNLLNQRCKALEGGTAMNPEAIRDHLAQVSGWHLSSGAIEKTFNFRNYHETLGFVNALGWIANTEDHHPELRVFYDRCVVRFDTHSVGGISINDFICAAKADALVAFVA